MSWLTKCMAACVAFALVLSFAFSDVVSANTGKNTDSINEKFGLPIVVVGDSLSDAQKQQVREDLGVTNTNNVEEIAVTADDIVKYINGDANSRMYSSAMITREDEGHGLEIEIVTPDNITEVTVDMYKNALLTAGIENATVEVASPVKVSGHSALTGIYKAYDTADGNLDPERTEVANDELDLTTDLAQQEGLDNEKVTQLMTDIKQDIAEQNPATREEVEQIVSDQLSKLEISLSEEDRQLLIDLFDKMRQLDIDFDSVKNQLEDIASTIQGKIDEVANNDGFWQGVKDFFKSIGDFFKNLF
ncbi:Uncharacterized protein YpuA, DUF1002 family [Terribacillus aidingensis]|uniref:Uncharacterized protein YpuA, DUF1002 family n=1 Tax=Terribacillus aidingensis TaxID=586416 RepID=A0A285N8Q3_9BACI|nr:DUF1002 domain-containing protein [Terribacillus aidingensis]SNZ04091.1 Uncharacterized protein YpuA, DUF1002 family [Terribacillus aidingensis]